MSWHDLVIKIGAAGLLVMQLPPFVIDAYYLRVLPANL